MKKIILKSVLFVLIFAFASIVCGCQFFDLLLYGGDSDNNGGNSNNNYNSSGSANHENTYSVKIYYDNDTEDYTFNATNKINIVPRHKKGYVLNGYYTQMNGQGTRMIDYSGKGEKTGWFDGCLMQLYPYYAEIDKSFVYKSGVAWEDNPASYWYNIYGDPHACTWNLNPEESTRGLEYIYKVAYSDSDTQFEITAYAEFREVNTDMYLAIGKDINQGLLVKKEFAKSSNFEKHSISSTINGSKILNNKDNKVFIGVFGKTLGMKAYVQNAYFTISIK